MDIFGGYIKSGDSSAFYIGFHDSVKVGEADNFQLSGIEYIRSISGGTKAYSSEMTHSHGSVTLTSYDVNGKRVVGTFNGVLYNEDQSNDSVKIENGHFNLSYTED
jgi:hypothetical protein